MQYFIKLKMIIKRKPPTEYQGFIIVSFKAASFKVAK